jgi:DNA repair exonuclease SbcCD ATPase subunit
MSPIGRIFIVLNLLLAAAFLGWASNAVATNQQWKAKHDQVETQRVTELADKDSEIAALTAEVGRQTTETANERNRANGAENVVTSLEQQLAEEKATNAELSGRIQSIEGKLGTINDTLAQVESDRDEAVEMRIAADNARDAALDAQQAAEDAQRQADENLTRAERQIADLERETEAQRQEISRLETEKATIIDATGVSLAGLLAVPLIEGKVLAYRDELGGLVTLNVGSEDGVMRGYTFEIYEGAAYEGRVRVQDVLSNMCSALVEQPVPGRDIGVGDNATTRL